MLKLIILSETNDYHITLWTIPPLLHPKKFLEFYQSEVIGCCKKKLFISKYNSTNELYSDIIYADEKKRSSETMSGFEIMRKAYMNTYLTPHI